MAFKGSRKVATVAVFGLGVVASTGFAGAQQIAAVTLPRPLPTVALPDAPMPAANSMTPAAGRVSLVQDVDVSVREEVKAVAPDEGVSQRATSEQIAGTAGAYSDIPRYLQTMPGVAFDSDARNTYLVNGGNATENMYVLDGVEMPNINHIGTNGSSGGFVSVIDTDAISDMTLHKQLYGSEYSGTLSSVLEMHTRVPEGDKRHGEVTLGYAGAGLVLEQPIGQFGSTMTQARHSVVNYLTDDIGLDGVPEYHSVLNTSTFFFGAHDTVRTLFLASGDDLTMRPNTLDIDDPNQLNTAYSGSRQTGAITWHHADDLGGSDLQVNYSIVHSTTQQTNAYQNDAPVYSDALGETPVTLRYDSYRQTKGFNLRGGFTLSKHGLDYQIDQAQGFPSPYSLDPTPVDASDIAVKTRPLNAAFYGEATAKVGERLELQGGMRFEHWGINDSGAWMPRAGFKFALGKRSFLFGGVASYAQMPSLPVMLGYASNLGLKPMRDVQTQFGFSGFDRTGGHFMASVYGRRYSDYPVSTEFTSLSLASMVDPFGQPFLYMPMVSQGHGKVLGIEAQYETDMRRRVFGQFNVSSQQVQHEALDGVWRRANFDMPVLANVLGGVHVTRRQMLTERYSFHTGTPYTPFDMNASLAQNREIFDMTQINAKRGGNYARLDLRYEVNVPLKHRNLKIYAGMENVLGRNNFYQYILNSGFIWAGQYQLNQMGRMADGGITWSF